MVRLSGHRSAYRGFTLIELLVTLAIMAVLAMAVWPVATLQMQRDQERELQRALIQIRTALDAYKQAADEGRIEKHVGDSGYPPNLNVLVTGVVDIKNVSGKKMYFLRRLPRDPMTTDSTVSAEQSWGLRSYDSSPEHPLPGKDVYDVYSLAYGNGLNGVAYHDW